MQALQPMLNDSTSFMSLSAISKSNNYEVNNFFLQQHLLEVHFVKLALKGLIVLWEVYWSMMKYFSKIYNDKKSNTIFENDPSKIFDWVVNIALFLR